MAVDKPERDPARIGDALAELGRSESARGALFEILRRAEAASADPEAFREHVRWPLVSALLPPGRTHRVQLVDGSTFEVSLDSRIERALMLSREAQPDHVWEPQMTKLLRALCRECTTVIVGGAYIGDQVIPMARAMERESVDGAIHAFEVSADKIAQLRRNLDLSGVGRVVVNRLALWDSSGCALGVVGDFALARCEPLDGTDGAMQEPVESITIDDYAQARGLDVGLIKLDLEGGEERALRGAIKLLSSPPPRAPNLVFEVHRDYVDWSAGLGATSIVTLVRACGYAVYAIRDFHDNRSMAGRPVEIVPLESVYLEGPPHGFDLLATRDSSLVDRLGLVLVPGVSPKLLAHQDPVLHSPRH
jgi:FkbM family methyltransferase